MLERINKLEKEAKRILEEIEQMKKKANMVVLGSLNPGDVFMIADKEFIVLEHDGNGTKVISKSLWGKSMEFGPSKNYAESSLRKFMENKILPELAAIVGEENIIEHQVDLTALDGGNDFGKVKCKIHPIEFMEARKYFHLLVNESLNDWWWTCSPWNSKQNGYKKAIAVVSPSGLIGIDGCCSGGIGVRPFCILRNHIFVSAK